IASISMTSAGVISASASSANNTGTENGADAVLLPAGATAVAVTVTSLVPSGTDEGPTTFAVQPAPATVAGIDRTVPPGRNVTLTETDVPGSVVPLISKPNDCSIGSIVPPAMSETTGTPGGTVSTRT